jgi:hypothetical protein
MVVSTSAILATATTRYGRAVSLAPRVFSTSFYHLDQRDAMYSNLDVAAKQAQGRLHIYGRKRERHSRERR